MYTIERMTIKLSLATIFGFVLYATYLVGQIGQF